VVCDAGDCKQPVPCLVRSFWSILEVEKRISGIKPENVRSNTINQNDPIAARKLQKEVKEYKYDHGQYKYGVLLGSI